MANRPNGVSKGVALMVAIGAIAVGFVIGRATAPKPAGSGADPQAVAAADGQPGSRGAVYREKRLELDPSPYKGADEAPVVIYEFSDFECPFCSRVNPTVDKVMATWPNDVKIVWKHRPLPFHKNATLAGIASAAAARQGHFWKYHDVLFANQKALQRPQLIKYAEELGMDVEQFKKDLDDPKLRLKVETEDDAAVAVGATGTPAFFINGVHLKGAQPFDKFKEEIERQLEKAKALEAKGVARKDIARRLTLQAGGKAAAVVKYVVDGAPAPKQAQKPKPKPKKEDTKTVWKVPVDAETEHIKGPKHALVTIAEFSDFECPFCSKVNPAIKKVRETYGDKVRVVFKHNPLAFHKNAPLASQAALAAGAQGKFWEMHDLLFANQKQLLRPQLEAHAEALGLDMAVFNKALDEGTYAEKIAEDQDLSQAVGARSTPTLFINGRMLKGAKPFEDLKPIIDEEIKKAQKLVDGGTKLEAVYGKLIAGGKIIKAVEDTAHTIPVGDSPAKGPASAPITIVEFSDFECPFCVRAAKPVKEVQAKYPEQIRVVFKQFPLVSIHKNAQKAAEATLAANEHGLFWEMHDVLFNNSKSLGPDKLPIYAEAIGLDKAAFSKALETNKFAKAVSEDVALGRKIGVRGTPSVYINGRKYSGQYTVAQLERLLTREFGLNTKDQ